MVVLEKTFENPLDCKIKPVNPKGNQPWIFIGRTDAEAEIPILLLSDVKIWLIRRDLDAGKDWRQEEKGTTEDEMVDGIHTVKGYSMINETELDVFLNFPSFLYDPTNVGNLISGSFAFSKPSLYIWKFSIQVLLKPGLKDLSITFLAWEVRAVVQ